MSAVDDHRRGQRATIGAFLFSLALALVKLVAGLLGNSYALIADAVESVGDTFGALIVWGGLRIAEKPADELHPYGHGKAEPLATLLVAFMLFGAAIGIGIQAIREILRPHHAPAPFTLVVLVGVVVTKEVVYRRLRAVAQEVNSSAVLADAWHHRSDAITSALAAIGISIALIGREGYQSADDWAALLATGVIAFSAIRLLPAPLHELMDAEPAELIAQVRTVAAAAAGILGVEKVFARKSGLRYWVDLHLEVDPALTVHAAHELSHRVKDLIRQKLPNVQDVLIHVEPHVAGGSAAALPAGPVSPVQLPR